MKLDLGDVLAIFELRVKGLQPPNFIWEFGHPKDRGQFDGIPVNGSQESTYILPERVYGIMDLQADKQVTFSLAATDEVGNPVVVEPGSFTFEFSVDDTSVLTLTDNGDGTGSVASTGALGVATLSGRAVRNSDGKEWTGAEAFNVVAGDAETFAFEFGEPTEVTPDV